MPTKRVVSIVVPIALHQRVLEQPIFVVHEADEDGWNGILRRGPKRMDREQAAAVAHEADGVLSRRKSDPDAERHGPAQPSATR